MDRERAQRQRRSCARQRPHLKKVLRETFNRDPPSSAIRRSSAVYRHVAGAAGDGDLVPLRGAVVVRALQFHLAPYRTEALVVEGQVGGTADDADPRGNALGSVDDDVAGAPEDANGDETRNSGKRQLDLAGAAGDFERA
jgi:hypothetical protein